MLFSGLSKIEAQTYTVNTCTYAPIAGVGTALPNCDDCMSGLVPIGFSFPFYGTNYTQVNMSSNGFLSFEGAAPQGCCSGQNLPSAMTQTIISFAWDDMYTIGATVNYFTTGTAPNRIFVVNYNNVGYCCTSANQATIQIQLYETSGEIRMLSANNNHVGRTATMGIQDNLVGSTVVTGRNATAWTSPANECISFVSSAAPPPAGGGGSGGCSFVGQNPFGYCINAAVDTFFGFPTGGTFTGPGMTDSIFDPAVAGIGSHLITYTTTGGGPSGVYDQDQPSNTTCMANFSQTDLAQSFVPTANTICGAGIFLSNNAAGVGDVTISLWDNLPNAGGTMLATGTVTASDNSYADVSWSSVSITPGVTYYLVFTSTNTGQCVAGDTGNPYANGQVFANAGYGSFPTFDYTFRTENCSGGGSGSCSFTQQIIVHDLPTVTANPGDTTICEGESVVLFGSASGSGAGGNRNILFVSDVAAGGEIATELTAAGYNVTTVLNDFAAGNNTVLQGGGLGAYSVIFWHAVGAGFGRTMQ